MQQVDDTDFDPKSIFHDMIDFDFESKQIRSCPAYSNPKAKHSFKNLIV
jgi:hypothetical protein